VLDQRGYVLSSANSINWGRVLPQIVYYISAYCDLIASGALKNGDSMNVCVPTGNFGNILAGYYAKCMGLPVNRLICASNANNVLTDFIRTGVYDRRRDLHKTDSPSMDILVSSNLERLLYLVSEDTALVARLMQQLNTQGHYQVSDSLLAQIQTHFWAGWCDDAKGAETIRRVWEKQHYLGDTHTASGWTVAEDYVNQTGDTRPMVVLSTASPYKFPAAVLAAIGGDTTGDEFTQMETLERVTGIPIPGNLAGLREKTERHTAVIDKDKMREFVLSL
jgi:threonine synthase